MALFKRIIMYFMSMQLGGDINKLGAIVKRVSDRVLLIVFIKTKCV